MTSHPTPRSTTSTTLTAALCAVGAALLAAAPAQASQYDRHDALCRTPDGRTPAIMNNPGSLHRAYAAMRNGQPVIVFNPRRMADLSPITRVWVYYHECAHHALGHTVGNRLATRENDADCWAIRAMRYRGILTAAHYRVIKADMHRVYRQGGDVHLPGHLRAEHLDLCLRTTGYGKIRNAKFTPLILRKQMAMRNGRPQGDPNGNPNGSPRPHNRPNYRPQARNGRLGEPEPTPNSNQPNAFNERRQLEEN
jgi:hypothetical protein